MGGAQTTRNDGGAGRGNDGCVGGHLVGPCGDDGWCDAIVEKGCGIVGYNCAPMAEERNKGVVLNVIEIRATKIEFFGICIVIVC